MSLRTIVLLPLRTLFLGRHRLALENLALRQQLAILHRKVPHPRSTEADRRFWLVLRALHDGWRDCLHLVSPATVVRWHRRGWRWYWGRRMKRHPPGRPTIGWTLFHLIRRLQEENPTWGAPRITSELRLLGHTVGQSTVSRYMRRFRQPKRSQGWTTFIRNTMKVTAACDFFVVPTVAFQRLFVFVVLSHDRRLIRHVAVTAKPTAAWTAEQLVEAFPDEPRPTYLVRDRDPLYGVAFLRQLEALGIEDTRVAPRQHWMNAYSERVVPVPRLHRQPHRAERTAAPCLPTRVRRVIQRRAAAPEARGTRRYRAVGRAPRGTDATQLLGDALPASEV